MGLYHGALMVAVVILTITSPVAASKESQLTSIGAFTAALENNTPTKRLLRAYTKDEEDGEEKGISAKIPGLAYALKSSRTSKTKELHGLLKADESLANAFKTLKLSTMPIGQNGIIESKLVVKLFTSTNFKVWSEYATKMNKQDPNGAMVTALSSVFGEKNLAIMILLGKDTKSSKGVAKKLESALFNSWFVKGKQPNDMLENVLNVKRRNIHMNSREKYIWADYSKYFTDRVVNY